jgi:hypothetical protein
MDVYTLTAMICLPKTLSKSRRQTGGRRGTTTGTPPRGAQRRSGNETDFVFLKESGVLRGGDPPLPREGRRPDFVCKFVAL